MLKNLVLLSTFLFLSIVAGCSGHQEEYSWVRYTVDEPRYIGMYIERDGRVRRAVQSGPEEGLYIPVKNTEFYLNNDEVEYLKQLMSPSDPETYYHFNKPNMRIHLNGIEHAVLPTDESKVVNEEAKAAVRFFRQLETRKAQWSLKTDNNLPRAAYTKRGSFEMV